MQLRHLRSVRISNVFLLDGGPGDRFLVDSGHAVERTALLLELRRLGLRPADVTGLLITHRHSDHAGNAAFLRRHGVKVYAHRADAEVLAGTRARPWMDPRRGSRIAGLLAEIENRWPARVPVDRALDDGDTVAGVEVHAAPGHTEGSVFYRHATTEALASGDALLTAHPPLVIREGFALAYATFSLDTARSNASVTAFHRRGVAYEHLLPGHGPPIFGGARARTMEFLARAGAA